MSKPVVLFDVDGFLLDFHTPALRVIEQVIHQRTGAMVALDATDFDTWDIFDVVGREYIEDCYREYEKPGWCSTLQPYPGAVEGVREAKKMVDVVIVTSPLDSPTWCYERKQAMQHHFGIPKQDVIFAARKALVKGRMLVDDRPSHVEEWAHANQDTAVAVLWDQPYNRHHAIEGAAWNVTRCCSWGGPNGLLEAVERVARAHK